MSDSENKNDLTRREAVKGLALGMGTIASLPVLNNAVLADHDHERMHGAQRAKTAEKPYQLKFFTRPENAMIIALSEHIIPADDNSPGAQAAKVNEYIDLIVSESPKTTQDHWREGLAAVDKKSVEMFGKKFLETSSEQQIELLKAISKNERSPQTIEERFFKTIKNATIDGYYTSRIGIHQELKYKGNTYLPEFKGCTHPEHQA